MAKVTISLIPDEMIYVLNLLSDRADFCDKMANDYQAEKKMIDGVCGDIVHGLEKYNKKCVNKFDSEK